MEQYLDWAISTFEIEQAVGTALLSGSQRLVERLSQDFASEQVRAASLLSHRSLRLSGQAWSPSPILFFACFLVYYLSANLCSSSLTAIPIVPESLFPYLRV